MKAAMGCAVWLALIGVGILIISLGGCAAAPEPEFSSPWGLDRNGYWNRPIPKPATCGHNCFRWEEPGLMVKP